MVGDKLVEESPSSFQRQAPMDRGNESIARH